MIRGWLFRKLMGMSSFEYHLIGLVLHDKKIRITPLMAAGIMFGAFDVWKQNNFYSGN